MTLGIDQAIGTTDPDRADAFGDIDRGTIGKRQKRETRSLPDEGVGQIGRRTALLRHRRIQHRGAGPRTATPLVAIATR
jgi:hypothetical protein